MKFSEKVIELSSVNASKLSIALRHIGYDVGNIELREIVARMVFDVGGEFYRLGVSHSFKEFSKVAERYEEDLYILESESRAEK